MVEKTAIIKPCAKKDIDPDRSLSEQQVCLYSKKNPGKLLGRHPNEESAKKQEQAIQISKHAAQKLSSLILEGKSQEAVIAFQDYQKEAIDLLENKREANFKAIQTYLLYEVAKRIVNYAKGKRLQKYADAVWQELFGKTFKISTRGTLYRGQEGGQYKIEGDLLFTNGDTRRPIHLLIVAAFWKLKPTILLQLKERNKRKPVFSILNKDSKKVIKEAKEYIANNLIYPPIQEGDIITVDVLPHKGRNGIVQTYQPMTKRLLVRLTPVEDEEPIDVWFDRNQVTLMSDNMINKQFQAAIDLLSSSYPDLAEKIAKTKERYEAKTDLEKMIGKMTYGQSGIWLTKEQMMSLVKELKKKGITSPKEGTYDDIAQAVGKLLDNLIPDDGDKKEKKDEKKEEKKEKKSTTLHPLTRQVFTILQRDYHFVNAHKNDPEEIEATWFKLDYVDDAFIKKGSLVLFGEEGYHIPNYVEGDFQSKDLDITMVHTAQGAAFDVLTIPAFGAKPASMMLDLGSSQYVLTAQTAEGLAAELAVIAEKPQFLKDERIAMKIEIEVEIEIDPKEIKNEGQEDEVITKSRMITENDLNSVNENEEEGRDIPLDQNDQSEPMVLDPNSLVEAPENAPEFAKPLLPPVPFPWSK